MGRYANEQTVTEHKAPKKKGYRSVLILKHNTWNNISLFFKTKVDIFHRKLLYYFSLNVYLSVNIFLSTQKGKYGWIHKNIIFPKIYLYLLRFCKRNHSLDEEIELWHHWALPIRQRHPPRPAQNAIKKNRLFYNIIWDWLHFSIILQGDADVLNTL